MNTKLLVALGIAVLLIGGGLIATFARTTTPLFGATVLFPSGGGTGTSTAPTYGKVLVGNAGGTYTLTATSSLGITSSGGATLISTSTVPTVGQLSYWTGNGYPSTLGSVATGTITGSTGLSVTAGQSVIGSGLTITNTGVTSLTATSPLVRDVSTGAVTISCATCLTAALTSLNGLTGASQTFATTSTATGWGFGSSGTVHTLNIPTASASIPLGLLSASDWSTFNNKGSGTVTSVTGTYPVQSSGGNTPAISLAFGTTTANTWSQTNIFSGIMQAARVIVSGIAAAFTPATEGELGFDTTDNQLKYYSGSAVRVLSPNIEQAFVIASSTMGTGTTTLKVSGYPSARTFTKFGCTSSGSGTFVAQFGDSTSSTTAVVSSTINTTTFTTMSANNAFTAGEAVWYALGSVTGAVVNPSCSFQLTTDAT